MRRWMLLGAILALIFTLTMPSGDTAGRHAVRGRSAESALYRNWLVGKLTDSLPAAGIPAQPAPVPATPTPHPSFDTIVTLCWPTEPARPQSRPWPTGLILLGALLFAAAIVAATLLDRRRQRLTR